MGLIPDAVSSKQLLNPFQHEDTAATFFFFISACLQIKIMDNCVPERKLGMQDLSGLMMFEEVLVWSCDGDAEQDCVV